MLIRQILNLSMKRVLSRKDVNFPQKRLPETEKNKDNYEKKFMYQNKKMIVKQ